MSSAIGGAAPPWPGMEAGGALVLPLPADAFADVAGPLLIDGLAFAPKAEFHLTLLARQTVAALLAAPAGGAQAVRAAFAAQDWRLRRTGERWLLRYAAAAGVAPRHSVIECVDAPALAAFRARLADATGVPLPVTPPHVTLYVAGGGRGIGLPSAAAFARRRVRRLA